LESRFSDIYDRFEGKFSNYEIKQSTLYVVSTPVGNLEDISYRALNVLRNVDLIAAEDTRKTGFLLKSFDIEKKVISYYSHVERSKLEQIINEIKSGKSIALVSDAGTPCISDPGNLLVGECISEGIEVVAIPGASSLMNALILSGFENKKFYFQGFLPQKKGRQTLLLELKEIKMTIIIFESPFRIYKTLSEINEVMGNKIVSVSRELTKKFEQTYRGRVKDLLTGSNGIKKIKPKGEFVIILNNN
jgi:16S rRNA (cytidine1402-2'-O)-methyltransferase